ncbi:hypothetical protein FVE85_6903 [Porphyridium purpureum]|uniref:Uncharacterized protein n=1 Tax=Porphyridium purpureum TaxID=35688 RepID=A0A5J4Z839_PORPP|nr:hypothetical protein FVE85_6903 [Porphyridium purpureum]|eukprot:POR0503..scf295_1
MLDARDEASVQRWLRSSVRLYAEYISGVSRGSQLWTRAVSRASDARRVHMASRTLDHSDALCPPVVSRTKLAARLVAELETALQSIRELIAEMERSCAALCRVADAMEAWMMNRERPQACAAYWEATSERPSVAEIAEQVLELHACLQTDVRLRTDATETLEDYQQIPAVARAWIARPVDLVLPHDAAAWWSDVASLEYVRGDE